MSLGSDTIDALKLCDQLRAAGASDAEVYGGLETFLRARWVNTRVWHYLCETCRDAGVELFTCPDRPCDRRQPHGWHEYIRPCFCANGERWRAKPKTEQTAVEAAARTPKPRGFSRMGR